MAKIRVMIIEDSKVIREFLEYIIGEDPRLDIAASVGSAEEALEILHRVSPDVVSMDIRLPGMNGVEATKRIMSEKPTPIVVVSASVESQDLQITMNALEAGALTVLEKPAGTISADYEASASRICTQLAIMSQVKVVRQRISVRPIVSPGAPPRPRLEPPRFAEYRMLGVVGSTGGPNALLALLGGLGGDFPLPIALVQHITASFLEGFAAWLRSACPLAVEIVRDRVKPAPGTVYLAASDRQLWVTSEGLRANHSEPAWTQRPPGTILFQSMAQALSAQAMGVLLTGMGDDGAEGLLEIRKKGGHTIAEDESTAVVYGMPAAAVRLGAVCDSLPLPAIAPRILELCVAKGKLA
jgi:two-component system chemotaxis response regulator CheB